MSNSQKKKKFMKPCLGNPLMSKNSKPPTEKQQEIVATLNQV